MKLPAIGLYNPYYLGDTVLLEGCASALQSSFNTDVYVISKYPEIFENNPYVIGLPFEHKLPLRIIDLTEQIKSIDSNNIPSYTKLESIYKAVGLGQSDYKKPNIYLSGQELNRIKEIKTETTGKKIGVALESRHDTKNYGLLWDLVIEQLDKNCSIYIYDNDGLFVEPYSLFENCIVNKVYGKPLRELMCYIKSMDVMVGIDTGTMHIAGALDVPTVVIGFPQFKDLYSQYSDCSYLSSKPHKPITNISAISVIKSTRKYLSPYKERPAIMLLEGLGGTVTISDHAKKVYERFGEKPDIIVRNYHELFIDNPYINDIIPVGMVHFSEAVKEWSNVYKRIATLKTGIGKWYGVKQDFRQWEQLYSMMPIGTNSLEKYGLNMTQMANKSLELPYDTIDSKVYYDEEFDGLPDNYIVFSNGVDTWHKGLHQTKCWYDEYWKELIWSVNIPFVQVGTKYDDKIEGAIDIRGMSSISELLWILKKATAVVTTEGGLMHLAYAVGNDNTIVLKGPTRGKFYNYPSQIQIDSPVCDYCYWDTPEWYKDCPKGINGVCMKMITPQRVALTLEELLDESLVEMPCVA